MRTKTRIIIALAILFAIAGWFTYDYMFSSNTVTEAIEQTAVEAFEEVYKIADVEIVDEKLYVFLNLAVAVLVYQY